MNKEQTTLKCLEEKVEASGENLTGVRKLIEEKHEKPINLHAPTSVTSTTRVRGIKEFNEGRVKCELVEMNNILKHLDHYNRWTATTN